MVPAAMVCVLMRLVMPVSLALAVVPKPVVPMSGMDDHGAMTVRRYEVVPKWSMHDDRMMCVSWRRAVNDGRG